MTRLPLISRHLHLVCFTGDYSELCASFTQRSRRHSEPQSFDLRTIPTIPQEDSDEMLFKPNPCHFQSDSHSHSQSNSLPIQSPPHSQPRSATRSHGSTPVIYPQPNVPVSYFTSGNSTYILKPVFSSQAVSSLGGLSFFFFFSITMSGVSIG